MHVLTRFILRHQRSVLIGLAVLAGLGIWQRTRLRESQTLQALIVSGDPRRAVYERMLRDFGDDEVLAVVVEAQAGTVYRPAVLAAIDDLTRQLAQVRFVRDVTSVTTVGRFGRWGPPYDPDGGEAGARRLETYIQTHPLYQTKLVSADGRSA